jgi:hypothetical protein
VGGSIYLLAFKTSEWQLTDHVKPKPDHPLSANIGYALPRCRWSQTRQGRLFTPVWRFLGSGHLALAFHLDSLCSRLCLGKGGVRRLQSEQSDTLTRSFYDEPAFCDKKGVVGGLNPYQ